MTSGLDLKENMIQNQLSGDEDHNTNLDFFGDRAKDLEYGWRLYFREPISQEPIQSPDETKLQNDQYQSSELQQLQLSQHKSSSANMDMGLVDILPQKISNNSAYTERGLELISDCDTATMQTLCTRNLKGKSTGPGTEGLQYINSTAGTSISGRRFEDPSRLSSRRERYTRSKAFEELKSHYLEVCRRCIRLVRAGLSHP